uniref:Uncharacterized protein n=1 Tax=Oryza meridionalis TaxID=40149 RepID=A0A0E0DDV5_9ORYZ
MALSLGYSAPQALALRLDLAESAESPARKPSVRLAMGISAPAKMALSLGSSAPLALALRHRGRSPSRALTRTDR